MTNRTPSRAALSAAVVALLLASVSWAQPSRRPGATPPALPEPISYTLRFPAPQTHYVEVEARVPTGKAASVDLMMPVWTPGSYLVREYSRNVEDFRAAAPDGLALAVEKTRKNHWKVTTLGAPSIVLRYRVYQRFMAVQGGWVEADFAMLNGAPTFITLAERSPRPHEVKLELPAAWATTSTGLPAAPGGAPHHYLAPDYDTLVDCPIVAGNQAVYEFTVGGKSHALVNVGEGGIWDGPRSAGDAEKIVRANEKLWGSLPYEKYVFLNMLLDAGGGLEHKSSTLLLSSRWRGSTRQGYLGWLGLASHEYFHAWNVKRLRPVELGPFDYDDENYTTGLWISEGFTDYYGDLMLPRAGLASRDEFLNSLSQSIQQLQTTPGRLVQSASMASFDAWIKQYRPDENSLNTSISYYTKGAVAAFLLDAEIQRATNGAKSLDDVMRLAMQRYGGTKGFTQAEFRKTASEVAGVDLTAWFTRTIDTTDEVDCAPALDWFGLRFKPAGEARQDHGWLGVDWRTDNGRALAMRIRRGTPAYEAGLNVDDELIAIGDFRVRADQIANRLQSYTPGQTVSLLVARREQLMRLDLTLGAEPPRGWQVEVKPDATAEQQARLKAWLWER